MKLKKLKKRKPYYCRICNDFSNKIEICPDCGIKACEKCRVGERCKDCYTEHYSFFIYPKYYREAEISTQ